jgi:IS5 family transposase
MAARRSRCLRYCAFTAFNGWFGEADPTMEEALHHIASLCRLAGLDASDDVMLDECAILCFSHLPEQHQLGNTIFAEVAGELSGKGLSTMRGTVVDAVLITPEFDEE